MDKKIGILYTSFVTLFIISQLALAQPSVCDWRGYAKINTTSLFDTNTSHVVTSYTNVAQATNGTTYSGGYYILHVPGSSGDTITLKICGVNSTQGDQTWSCNDPGYHTLNISINTSANGAVCTYACGCTGGYCNSGVCASSPPVTTTTTTTLGGGGGGGSDFTTTTLVTTTTTIAPIVETKTVSKIENGTSATFNITESNNLKVETIEVEVKNTVTNVELTIKESSLPAGANVAIAADKGAIYKYFEITKTNIQDVDINKVNIKFKVEKSWINTNGIDPDKIILQRLVGSSWNKLSTIRVSEDSTYYYYEAESPGLSIFAIVGEKKAVTTTTIAATTTTSIIPQVEGGSVTMIVVILIIVAIILIVAGLILFKPKKKSGRMN